MQQREGQKQLQMQKYSENVGSPSRQKQLLQENASISAYVNNQLASEQRF